MKKTKHFNISVPELGDVPDITQVSNAISDLEDATAGTLEIMKAEMQGTKITLTSVSRKTKRTGYYEGMSIRFKSPQDIEPNYLKTVSVDDLSDQVLSVAYKVNRNEYIDIVYEEDKFTAYPVVVQKTDSVSNNSSVLVGTAKGVKTAYDKGVEALNKANQAQSSASQAQSTADGKENKIDKKSGFNLDKSDSVTSNSSNTLATSKAVKTAYDKASNAERIANTKEPAISKKTGFNLEKTSDYKAADVNKVFTQAGANSLYKEVSKKATTQDYGRVKVGKYLYAQDGVLSVNVQLDPAQGGDGLVASAESAKKINDNKLDKTGGKVTGSITVDVGTNNNIILYKNGELKGIIGAASSYISMYNSTSKKAFQLNDDGSVILQATNLTTSSKDVVGAINELNKNFRFLGSITTVGGVVPVGDYKEYIVYIRYSPEVICRTIYLTNEYLKKPTTLKHFRFYEQELECEFEVANSQFKLLDLGANDDGGIDIWVK